MTVREKLRRVHWFLWLKYFCFALVGILFVYGISAWHNVLDTQSQLWTSSDLMRARIQIAALVAEDDDDLIEQLTDSLREIARDVQFIDSANIHVVVMLFDGDEMLEGRVSVLINDNTQLHLEELAHNVNARILTGEIEMPRGMYASRLRSIPRWSNDWSSAYQVEGDNDLVVVVAAQVRPYLRYHPAINMALILIGICCGTWYREEKQKKARISKTLNEENPDA